MIASITSSRKPPRRSCSRITPACRCFTRTAVRVENFVSLPLEFDPDAVKFWEWVRADSGCTCGEALRTRRRAIASDVETCVFMAGTPDREAYLQAGMRAAQSTPLISRDGRLLGMLSTHWRKAHQPGERELRRFDILARQAADVVERAQTTAALRESEAQFRTQAEASARQQQ